MTDNTDEAHSSALKQLKDNALSHQDIFGEWARTAEHNPDEAYKSILGKLGHLPVQKPWSIFAPIYNEDTPDAVFQGLAKFVDTTFNNRHVAHSDLVVDVASGTGALSRNLVKVGYQNIIAFDESPQMLKEARRLNQLYPQIQTLEASIENVRLASAAKAMAWCDFSSNFALTEHALRTWLQNLIDNVAPDGTLIFDVRTTVGWEIDFFKQKVTTFATDNFQRIWINLPNHKNQLITFDIFIRIRKAGSAWGGWQREQMRERMWSVSEVTKIIRSLKHSRLIDIHNDTLKPLKQDQKSGLVYFVLARV